jgi:Icc-related predicted phosphoesterase
VRLLATADLHGFESVYRWMADQALHLKVDAVLLAGDLLGVPDGYPIVEHAMRASAERIKNILSGLDCPVLYIMGNDDLVELGSDEPHRISIHNRRVEQGGFGFVGYQCGPPFVGGPFERSQEKLEIELLALADLLDDRTVLVTHYPAAGVLDGGFGLRAIRELVDRVPCLAHIHGHSHRNFGSWKNHFNVASAGQDRGMLIDLQSRVRRVLCGGEDSVSCSWP